MELGWERQRDKLSVGEAKVNKSLDMERPDKKNMEVSSVGYALRGASAHMDFAHKLAHMLDHWIEHNAEHAAHYREKAQAAREAGLDEAARMIEEAAVATEGANASLKKALDRVGGH